MNQRVLICLLAAALLGAAWMFRWQVIELHSSNERSYNAYLMNRWTGKVFYLAPQGGWIVPIEEK